MAKDDGDKYVPQSLGKEHFTEAFRGPDKKLTMTPDWERLTQSEGVRDLAKNYVRLYDDAVRDPKMFEAGRRFYPRENERLSHIGEQFNTVRASRDMPTYFEHKPEVAGLLLQTMFSFNNTESNRNRLVRETAKTGIVQPHLGTSHIENAIASGKHAMDVFAEMGQGHGLKAYDFGGSILHPGQWHGEWKGVKRGLGYTIDRHQHDAGIGVEFGSANRPLSSSDVNIRRYRAFQAGHLLAHHGPGGITEKYGHDTSPDEVQSVIWGPWRGGYE